MHKEEKIKVLFISSWYPTRVNPTLGNFVQKHAEASSLFADVRVLHVRFDDALTEKKFDFVYSNTHFLKTLIIYCKRPWFAPFRILRFFNAYKKGLKILTEQNWKPDIIHGSVLFPVGLVLLFCKSFKKIPLIFTEHWTIYTKADPSKPSMIMKFYTKMISKRTSRILPVSEDLSKAMQFMGLTGNYQVVPNVVDTALFTVVPKKQSDKKNILHISTLVDVQKNVFGILNGIKKCSEQRHDFVLNIVSDGNQDMFIEAAKEMGLYNSFVFFHGTKTTNQIAEIMQQSDFLLLFSNYENFPCVITEAFSCGIPVLSTNVGGISEHLTPKHGMLIKPKDEQELVLSLNAMLDNLNTYDAQFLHQYAEDNFSYEAVGKQFYEVYNELLKNQGFAK